MPDQRAGNVTVRDEVIETQEGRFIAVKIPSITGSDWVPRRTLIRVSAIDIVEPIFLPPMDKGARSVLHVGGLLVKTTLTVEEIEEALRG